MLRSAQHDTEGFSMTVEGVQDDKRRTQNDSNCAQDDGEGPQNDNSRSLNMAASVRLGARAAAAAMPLAKTEAIYTI